LLPPRRLDRQSGRSESRSLRQTECSQRQLTIAEPVAGLDQGRPCRFVADAVGPQAASLLEASLKNPAPFIQRQSSTDLLKQLTAKKAETQPAKTEKMQAEDSKAK
jgi:hypothetical protein